MTIGFLTRRPKLRRANLRTPCPVCEGDGCGLGDGFTVCWRVGSNRQAKSGAWIHYDENAPQRQFISRAAYIAPPLAPIERRHAVYSALLDRLPLYKIHADQLASRRRLSETTIVAEGFASVPPKSVARLLVDQLAGEFDLSYVPGFFKGGGRWHLRFVGLPGFYIPIRDDLGRIAALEIRRDTDDPKRRFLLLSTGGDDFPLGASSGAPPHFARPHRRRTVVITEGALKANVCAELLDVCVVGLVAVSTFGGLFGWELRDALPGMGTIYIGYDADWQTNDKVKYHMGRLTEALSKAGLYAKKLEWPLEQGKGLDDYLMNGGLG